MALAKPKISFYVHVLGAAGGDGILEIPSLYAELQRLSNTMTVPVPDINSREQELRSILEQMLQAAGGLANGYRLSAVSPSTWDPVLKIWIRNGPTGTFAYQLEQVDPEGAIASSWPIAGGGRFEYWIGIAL